MPTARTPRRGFDPFDAFDQLCQAVDDALDARRFGTQGPSTAAESDAMTALVRDHLTSLDGLTILLPSAPVPHGFDEHVPAPLLDLRSAALIRRDFDRLLLTMQPRDASDWPVHCLKPRSAAVGIPLTFGHGLGNPAVADPTQSHRTGDGA